MSKIARISQQFDQLILWEYLSAALDGSEIVLNRFNSAYIPTNIKIFQTLCNVISPFRLTSNLYHMIFAVPQFVVIVVCSFRSTVEENHSPENETSVQLDSHDRLSSSSENPPNSNCSSEVPIGGGLKNSDQSCSLPPSYEDQQFYRTVSSCPPPPPSYEQALFGKGARWDIWI